MRLMLPAAAAKLSALLAAGYISGAAGPSQGLLLLLRAVATVMLPPVLASAALELRWRSQFMSIPGSGAAAGRQPGQQQKAQKAQAGTSAGAKQEAGRARDQAAATPVPAAPAPGAPQEETPQQASEQAATAPEATAPPSAEGLTAVSRCCQPCCCQLCPCPRPCCWRAGGSCRGSQPAEAASDGGSSQAPGHCTRPCRCQRLCACWAAPASVCAVHAPCYRLQEHDDQCQGEQPRATVQCDSSLHAPLTAATGVN